MTTPVAALATDDYGIGSTTFGLVRDGFSALATATASLATDGYGTGGSTAVLVTDYYAAFSTLPVSPPAGKQFVIVGNLPWSGRSYFENASPPVKNGDVALVDLVTDHNHVITPHADGTFELQTDTDTARQSFQVNVYSVALGGYYGSSTVWVNNHPPTQVAAINPPILSLNAPMVPIDLGVAVSDAEGDVLVYTRAPTTPLPPGLFQTGSVISGTPTLATVTTITESVADVTGESITLSPITFTISSVPYLIGLTQTAATALIVADGFRVGTITTAFSTASPGTVIDQTPVVGVALALGGAINIVLASNTSSCPDFFGLTLAAARQLIGANGYVLVPDPPLTVTADYPAGSVVQQTPLSGTTMSVGFTVSLTISSGPVIVILPVEHLTFKAEHNTITFKII